MELYLADSPLQALNAVEYSKTTQSKSSMIIVNYGHGNWRRNKAQITSAINLGSFDRVLSVSGSQIAAVRTLKLRILSVLLWLASSRIESVVIGDWRKSWMRRVITATNPARVILLDDGFGTILLGSEGLDSRSDNQHLALKKLRGKASAFERYWHRSTDLVIFTAFCEKIYPPYFKVERNAYNHLRSLAPNVKTNEIYYFGSKYSEAGYLGLSEELDFVLRNVSTLRKLLPTAGLYYVAHRGDALEKLNKLRFEGVSVLQLETPAEIHFQSIGVHPKFIAGAFSSVLVTLPCILAFDRVLSFTLPVTTLDAEKRQAADECNAYLKRIGVEFVS